MLAACAPDTSEETPANKAGAQCDGARTIAALPAKLHEASGVAASARHPGILWVHNDSGEPIIFAIDTLGKERGRVRLAAPNTDWEDIDVAPCPEGSCIYLGAIGDNLQRRQDRAVLRFLEPALEGTPPIRPIRLRYQLPDAAHDTEAMFVMPDARIFLVTKGRSGPITVFRFPDKPSADDVNRLEEVQRLTPGLVQLPDMVTGAGTSPDGKVIAIRTYSTLQFYSFDGARLAPLLAGTGFDLQPLGEFQGEGVDIMANGSVYLVSEKGLADEDPPLSKVSCSLGN
jgi:hypothetical protein